MRVKKKAYHLILPKKLKLWLRHIKKNPPHITAFKMSRMEYLLSTILSHKQDNHQGAYSLLNMQYLRNIIPNANDYLNFLKQENVIEWVNYLRGRNSRMYRLTSQYDGPVEYRTLTDQQLARRIDKAYSQLKLRNSKKYPQLNKYVYSVSIDAEAAIHTVNNTYQYTYKENKAKAEARRAFSLAEISNIEAGKIYIKVSATNGRYDTNYTRLPSELTQHLSIDDIPLNEVDIINSQPFFAAALFNPTPGIETIISRYLGKKFTMYLISLHLAERKDVKLYMLLVTTGTFYEYMMQQFRDNKITFTDRSNFKEQLFTVFFCKNSAIQYSRSVKLFASLFPNVYTLFTAIKENEHNRLAILLQRIESYTMLDCVAQKILTELPELKFITKHDSIMPAGLMVAGKSGEVEKLLLEVVEEVVGLRPQLKLKKPAYYSSIFSLSSTCTSPLCIRKLCK